MGIISLAMWTAYFGVQRHVYGAMCTVSMQQPTVSILIVTYNSSAELSTCLDSIAASTTTAHEIIVVDNASSDDTPHLVHSHYPHVKLVENDQNVGFAAAVNQAASQAQGRYLLLLNPDTVIHAGAIDCLSAFLQAHPEAGICAPRTLRSDGTLRASCFEFATPWSRFWTTVAIGPLRFLSRFLIPRPPWRLTADVVQAVEAVCGAALLIPAQIYQQVGGLDERFFMYYEDFDLCYRVQEAGYLNLFIPQAVITHHGQHTIAGQTVRLNGMIGEYSLPAQYHYIHKYYGPLPMWGMRLLYGGIGLGLWGGATVLPLCPATRNLWRNYGRLLALTPIPRHSALHGEKTR